MMTLTQSKDIYEQLEFCIDNIKTNPLVKYNSELKDLLNKFFQDSKCLGVIYTPNLDKQFFGLCIMPVINADDVIRVITTDKRYRVDKYYLELDGKLFDQWLNLNNKEITALLIHDIGAMTNTSAPSEEVCKNIDEYLCDNKETLKLSDIIHYKEILSFGFRDALRKVTSIFELGEYNKDKDTFSDFITWTNYIDYINNALYKIENMGWNYNKNTETKFLGLYWVLRVYKNVLGYRISAIKTLERMQDITPSELERKEFNNFSRRLTRIDDDMLLEDYSMNRNINAKDTKADDQLLLEVRNHMYPFSTNVLDPLDISKNDLIGILLKADNLDPNEPNAISDLIHNCNNRMTMIQDYVENNERDPVAFKQWNALFKELAQTRKDLSKHILYRPRRGLIRKYKQLEEQ